MSKFTSGEWHIERNVHDAYSDVEHELVVPEDWCIGKDYIAAVIDPTDARLIAAAPEMYRILVKVLDDTQNGQHASENELIALLNAIDGENREFNYMYPTP